MGFFNAIMGALGPKFVLVVLGSHLKLSPREYGANRFNGACENAQPVIAKLLGSPSVPNTRGQGDTPLFSALPILAALYAAAHVIDAVRRLHASREVIDEMFSGIGDAIEKIRLSNGRTFNQLECQRLRAIVGGFTMAISTDIDAMTAGQEGLFQKQGLSQTSTLFFNSIAHEYPNVSIADLGADAVRAINLDLWHFVDNTPISVMKNSQHIYLTN